MQNNKYTGLLTTLACAAGLSACAIAGKPSSGAAQNNSGSPVPNVIQFTPLPPAPLPTSFSLEMQSIIKRDTTQAKAQMERTYKRLAKDGHVSRDALQAHANTLRQTYQTRTITKLLSLDVNSDGFVSEYEASELMQREVLDWQRGNTNITLYSNADINNDSFISTSEIIKFAQQSSNGILEDWGLYLNVFDKNDDAIITPEELKTGLNLLTAGMAAKPESLTPLRQRKKVSASTTTATPKACTPTTPPKGADVIFLSGYEGSGLSNIAVAGQDKEAEVTRLHIEAGTKPLYIVATSYTPMVWSITGQSDRVTKLLTASYFATQEAGVGVTGLKGSQVEFLAPNCLGYFHDTNASKMFVAKAKWSQLLGISEPSKVVTNYTLSNVKLPSGDMHKLSREEKKPLSQQPNNATQSRQTFDLFRYTEEGLISIPPKDVISPKPIKAYEVLPQEAGLIQMVNEGYLKPLERGAFYIEKSMPRFPAGLNGAHSVKFILGKGAEMPKGSPGHSSVLSEETGNCLTRSCR